MKHDIFNRRIVLFIILLFSFCGGSFAQSKKVALVIGNASYAKSPLHNPLNDAEDVSAKLKTLGYDIIKVVDCKTKRDMRSKLDAFCVKAANADAGVFYYSGHGIQLTKEGGNYLIPIEAEMTSEADVEEYCIPLQYVLDKMEECGINMKVVIIDACRDNPFRTWQRGGARGLSKNVEAPSGTFIAFATNANNVAADGNERNSPFTNAFLTALDGDDLEINNVFTEVKRIVNRKTNGQQHPWTSNDLTEHFYLGTPSKKKVIESTTSVPTEAIKKSDNNKSFAVNGVSFKMIYVEGGTFTMGETADKKSVQADATPVHRVALSSFMLGESEVTQALWKAVMGSNPSEIQDNRHPVNGVSWELCQKFIKKLNKMTGKKFTLPTEAQWEYAAKGGKHSAHYKYSGSDNANEVAWYTGNSHYKSSQPVKALKCNELGIYDMSGNVKEWCNDWWGYYSDGDQTNPTGPSSGKFKVCRGGCSFNGEEYQSTSFRDYYMLDGEPASLGLRLCLNDPE